MLEKKSLHEKQVIIIRDLKDFLDAQKEEDLDYKACRKKILKAQRDFEKLKRRI